MQPFLTARWNTGIRGVEDAVPYDCDGEIPSTPNGVATTHQPRDALAGGPAAWDVKDAVPYDCDGEIPSAPNGVATTHQPRNALPAAAGGVNKLFTVSSNFPLAFLCEVGYIVLALSK